MSKPESENKEPAAEKVSETAPEAMPETAPGAAGEGEQQRQRSRLAASAARGAAQVNSRVEQVRAALARSFSRAPGLFAALAERLPWVRAALARLFSRVQGLLMTIAARMTLILFGSVGLVALASVVAWSTLQSALQFQSRIADVEMPNIVESVQVARQTSVLVNGGFRIISAQTQQEHEVGSEIVKQGEADLKALIENLDSRSEFGAAAERVEQHLAELERHLGSIRRATFARLLLQRKLDEHRAILTELSRDIESALAEVIDDQGFYLVEGLRSLEASPAPLAVRASENEFFVYRNLTRVNQQVNLAILLLDEMLILNDRQFLPPLEERFTSAITNARFSNDSVPASAQDEALGADLQKLDSVGHGGGDFDGIIVLRRELLLRAEQGQSSLDMARDASDLLEDEVSNLSTLVSDAALAQSAAARESVASGVIWLASISLASAVAAALFGYFFVWKSLARRLTALSGAMREMSHGDLEVAIEVGGNDEISDMAEALEKFREYALEVQRLNLVEELAKEVDAKNASLQETLQELEKAQQQIIAEEKLASLGQLAAGIAHEIKNPLNFIGNFSEIAMDFGKEIEELLEDLEESDAREDIREIVGDLGQSLGKIRDHSKRADNIVRSMLEHSRGGEGEWRETDLNAVLKQYVELAYHSMRALNTGFNMDLVDNFDPQVKPMEVVPQDISRVFLNLATNACQALDDKRKRIEDFEPVISISSKLLEKDAQFVIRDNGPGIPQKIRDKIFEPFFTTKDGTKGTGLGLSLTADILQRHGGSIAVNSEEGEFTEMVIRLPLEPVRHD